MAVDELSGSGGGSRTGAGEEAPAPRIVIEATPGQDPIITIELTDPAEDVTVTHFSTYDIYDALDFLTASNARQFADELAERYDRAANESRFRLPGAGDTRKRAPAPGTDPAARADRVDPKLAEALQVLQELEEAENAVSLVQEPPAPDGLDEEIAADAPVHRSETGRSRSETDRVPAPDDGMAADERADAAEPVAGDGGMAWDAFGEETRRFLSHEPGWYIFEWAEIPTLEGLSNAWHGLERAATDPEIRQGVIEGVEAPSIEKITERAKLADFIGGGGGKARGFRPRLKPKPKIRTRATPGPQKTPARRSSTRPRPTLGERKVKRVERTAAYRRMSDRRVDGKPVIETKKAPSKGKGAQFQRDVSGGKDVEYVGRLRRGKRRPDGKRIRKTVQIDELRQADDGRLVLAEAKWAKPDIDFADSGHVRYGIASKVDHLKRLARFARENPDDVNRIEIWVNASKSGEGVNSVAGEIYKAILMTMSNEDQSLFTIKYL